MEINENRLTQNCFEWFNNNFCLKHHPFRGICFHIPNEGQHKLVSIGVLPGVADICIVYMGKVAWFELKTPEGKRTQKKKNFENQKDFEIRVQQQGQNYYLCLSLEEFQQAVYKEWPELSPARSHANPIFREGYGG